MGSSRFIASEFSSSTEIPELTQVFLEGLREHGYIVGHDLQIQYRYFRGSYEQMPRLLAELVAFSPEVIVTSTSNSALAIHAAAPTIPMVFLNVADPVGLGLVKSLAHPGGNVTGFATVVPEGIIGKHLQFLKGLVPQASRIAVLINPTEKMHQLALQKLPEIKQALGVDFVLVEASEPDQFATAFENALPRIATGERWALRQVGDGSGQCLDRDDIRSIDARRTPEVTKVR